MQGLMRNQSTYMNISCLSDMLEKSAKNYAYRLLQLEMTIDQAGLSIGRTKKQDISQLIQLYMIGVQVLQCSGDSRFGYFRTKLHDLMLKKEVAKQLKFTAPEEVLKKQKAIRQQKRKQYQSILAKTEQLQTKHVNSIINTAATTVENYKSSIQSTLKKQQSQIKERLNSRSKRPQTASTSIPKSAIHKKQFNSNEQSSQYYSPPTLPKTKRQMLGLQPKNASMQSSPIERLVIKVPKPQFNKSPISGSPKIGQ